MCLLVGPACVGKTLLLKRLQSQSGTFSDLKDDVPATIPTVGTNLVTVPTLKKSEVTIREMGGAMGPIWHKYYKDATSIVFMLDAAKQVQMAVSCVQLMNLLSHPKTQNLSVLILVNKMDAANSMSRSELENVMRLQEVIQLANQQISILEVSAKTGLNLDKVIKWIYQHDKPNVETGS